MTPAQPKSQTDAAVLHSSAGFEGRIGYAGVNKITGLPPATLI